MLKLGALSSWYKLLKIATLLSVVLLIFAQIYAQDVSFFIDTFDGTNTWTIDRMQNRASLRCFHQYCQILSSEPIQHAGYFTF